MAIIGVSSNSSSGPHRGSGGKTPHTHKRQRCRLQGRKTAGFVTVVYRVWRLSGYHAACAWRCSWAQSLVHDAVVGAPLPLSGPTLQCSEHSNVCQIECFKQRGMVKWQPTGTCFHTMHMQRSASFLKHFAAACSPKDPLVGPAMTDTSTGSAIATCNSTEPAQ